MKLRTLVIPRQMYVKISTLTGLWKKLIPGLMDDFAEFKTEVVELTSNVLEIARELELQVQPEDMTKYLLYHEKLQQMNSCFFWMSKTSGFLKWIYWKMR